MLRQRLHGPAARQQPQGDARGAPELEGAIEHGGSPIGNSRVKLTNVKDCVKRGLVKEGDDPQEVAADQLVKDGVDVLHTIGGDDTNTAAADLAKFLQHNDYELTVVGLPKTIDNDVIPIRQSLGAWTAAEEGAILRQRVGGTQRRWPHAHRPRGDGAKLRVADRRHRPEYRKLIEARWCSCPSSA